MKLSVIRGGGVAGVVTKTEVESDDLSRENDETLHKMVQDAGVFELHETAEGPSHPDELSYELSVEHEGRRHTVRLRDSTMPEAVRSLISWASSVPGGRTGIDPGSRRG